ncbi:MAG: TlpA disulfide reductase family protein [Bryobacteraceae bacterium]|nr:TlpA disulfide reductase family protein [Bryobacteraceae bacterium]
MRKPRALLFSAAAAACLLAAPSLAAVVPRPSPDLVIETLDGKKVSVGQFKGKVVVLEILLTTCPHCQEASRIMGKLRTEYASKGLEALGAAIDDTARANLPNYIRQFGVNFPIGIIPREKAYEYLQQSMMVGLQMPQIVFIDRKGQIRAQYDGRSPFFMNEERNMRQHIEELLKEPAAAAPAAAKKKGSK